ncbi:hypothetical protein [Paratractidigestivibacter sp.]|uniref:hypothetical protein n=1 Tax=Paratractidigestivibacter sp. TaxID=2847316 RepID=UPI002AC954DA|nr:hypothetical protein [Paratractidigestivibacter sp.]
MQYKCMPQSRIESIVFTAITAFFMVYFMTLYNTVLATGEFYNRTFLIALQSMWLEYVLIFLCAYFISGPVAKRFAFQVVRPGDRQIYVIMAIQTFTVICQVALAAILGVWHGYGFTRQLLPDYIMTYCKNFIMALPLQLIIVGPLSRVVFRAIYGRAKQKRLDAEDEAARKHTA